MKKRWILIFKDLYYDKEVCANCPFADKCCGGKYRVVMISGGILALDMMLKFEDYLNVLKYARRFSTVEPPNGTLKRQYHINELLTPGLIKSQNRINICGGSYNLKRIYNQLMQKDDINSDNIVETVEKLCKYVNIIMPMWRHSNPFPFLEKKLKIPAVCESFLEKSITNEKNPNQATLDAVM